MSEILVLKDLLHNFNKSKCNNCGGQIDSNSQVFSSGEFDNHERKLFDIITHFQVNSLLFEPQKSTRNTTGSNSPTQNSKLDQGLITSLQQFFQIQGLGFNSWDSGNQSPKRPNPNSKQLSTSNVNLCPTERLVAATEEGLFLTLFLRYF